MGKKSGVTFMPDAADYLLNRYLEITILRFTPEMGKRLREVREKDLHCTQRELADQLGISQTDICRLENGKRVNSLPNTTIFKTVLDRYFNYVLFGGYLFNQTELTIEHDRTTNRWWATLKK